MKNSATAHVPGSGSTLLRRFWYRQDGTTTLEYALVLALISVAAVLSYQSLGLVVGDNVSTSQEGVAACESGIEQQAGDPNAEDGGGGGSASHGHGQGGNSNGSNGRRGHGRPDVPPGLERDGRDRGQSGQGRRGLMIQWGR